MAESFLTMFDHWRQPVLALEEGKVAYANEAAGHLFPGAAAGAPAEVLPPPLPELSEDQNACFEWEGTSYPVTVSRHEALRVLVLEEPPGAVSLAFLDSLGARLRESLSVLQMSFSFLRPYLENYRDDKIARYCAVLSRSGHELLHLAEGLQRLADLEKDPRNEPFSALDLVALARDLTETVSGLIRSREVTLTFSSNLPEALVSGSGPALEQMLLALLSNSIKFTAPGGTVTVSVTRGAAGILLSVRDTGCGIAPEVRQRVLRSPRSEGTAPMEGVGLGLPVVQRCAHLHGGSVILDSRPGRGTAVTVCLPPLRPDQVRTPTVGYEQTMTPILTELAELLDLEAFLFRYSD